MRILLATLLCILFIACTKNYSSKLEGRYSGTFHRYIDPVSNPASSKVTLYFSEDDFSGTSTLQYYPAICNGTYTASANKLNVHNKCAFPAIVLSTNIFDGEYNYKLNRDTLHIWKDYLQGQKDIYLLIREK